MRVRAAVREPRAVRGRALAVLASERRATRPPAFLASMGLAPVARSSECGSVRPRIANICLTSRCPIQSNSSGPIHPYRAAIRAGAVAGVLQEASALAPHSSSAPAVSGYHPLGRAWGSAVTPLAAVPLVQRMPRWLKGEWL